MCLTLAVGITPHFGLNGQPAGMLLGCSLSMFTAVFSNSLQLNVKAPVISSDHGICKGGLQERHSTVEST